jgi:hypothetical protein
LLASQQLAAGSRSTNITPSTPVARQTTQTQTSQQAASVPVTVTGGPAPQATAQPAAEVQAVVNNNTPAKTDINFRVQFATTTVEKPLNAPEFKGLQNVSFYLHDGLFKYTVGREKSLEAAMKVQQKLHEIGFKDAFVVAFRNNDRITPAEAIRLLKNNE